ncbi:hypothetical protein I302_102902 [Kwoniella bestiolae CBS 10118]|uniref:Uncharacterized protein n=1 Tax=Kwoniella bestiolae CBS 10118 TaxID=1296100 RepID=A0A1B9GGH5_9TREE|nr:hypothetical protein I302_01597 [Kwoniella bestiolae CBS 10118]OCF30078.1 hypothetical protein I302_01597 [Kwoniella bestiolae CBS 10118]
MTSSPTLSEMEFPSSPTPTHSTHAPATQQTPKQPSPSSKKASTKKGVDMNKLCRFLPPRKDEAFIGRILPTVEETITQIRHQCPSLSTISPSSISLKIRFDGKNSQSCEDVLFKIPGDITGCWPNAISDKLHLVFVEVASGHITPTEGTTRSVGVATIGVNKHTMTDHAVQVAPGVEVGQAQAFAHAILHGTSIPETTTSCSALKKSEEEKDLTWDELKRDGTLLGVQGHSDRPTVKRGGEETKVVLDNENRRVLVNRNEGFKEYQFEGI